MKKNASQIAVPVPVVASLDTTHEGLRFMRGYRPMLMDGGYNELVVTSHEGDLLSGRWESSLGMTTCRAAGFFLRTTALVRELGKTRHDLNHFVEAQEHIYDQALSEIRSGLKRTHWMWFVFPQLAGLGSSATAARFSIGTADEALAYLKHPILGPRLIECSVAVLSVQGKSARQIFGTPDDLKLRSCATLFAHLSPPNSVFHQILARYYGGEPDLKTLGLLAANLE